MLDIDLEFGVFLMLFLRFYEYFSFGSKSNRLILMHTHKPRTEAEKRVEISLKLHDCIPYGLRNKHGGKRIIQNSQFPHSPRIA